MVVEEEPSMALELTRESSQATTESHPDTQAPQEPQTQHPDPHTPLISTQQQQQQQPDAPGMVDQDPVLNHAEGQDAATATPAMESTYDTPKLERVRSVIRVRPHPEVHDRTASADVATVVAKPEEGTITIRSRNSKNSLNFSADAVYGEGSTQEQVYSCVKPLIESTVEGINATVFCYGQTSTGKTYTMLGEGLESHMVSNSRLLRSSTHKPLGSSIDELEPQQAAEALEPGWGIIPRAVRHLFQIIGSSKCDVDVFCSYMQIYNDKLYDLLTDPKMQKPLQVRETQANNTTSLSLNEDGFDDALRRSGSGTLLPHAAASDAPSTTTSAVPSASNRGHIFVQGLSHYSVYGVQDVMALVRRGIENRAMRATEYNVHSSRSHAILQLNIEVSVGRSGEAGDGEAEAEGMMVREIRRSKLTLIDLAGSEKWGVSAANNETTAKELTTINSSLSALGKCIHALSQSNRRHIPYRDSVLTRLLQDSLGGNTRTMVVATISRELRHLDETTSTLAFAARAQRVTHKLTANQVVNDAVLLKKAHREIEDLKRQLLERQQPPRDTRHASPPPQRTGEREALLEDQVRELRAQVALLESLLQGQQHEATYTPTVGAERHPEKPKGEANSDDDRHSDGSGSLADSRSLDDDLGPVLASPLPAFASTRRIQTPGLDLSAVKRRQRASTMPEGILGSGEATSGKGGMVRHKEDVGTDHGGMHASRGDKPPEAAAGAAACVCVCVCRALYDYGAQEAGDLSLRKGEVLKVMDQSADGWWRGVNVEGGEGVFPCHYVESFDLHSNEDKYDQLLREFAAAAAASEVEREGSEGRGGAKKPAAPSPISAQGTTPDVDDAATAQAPDEVSRNHPDTDAASHGTDATAPRGNSAPSRSSSSNSSEPGCPSEHEAQRPTSHQHTEGKTERSTQLQPRRNRDEAHRGRRDSLKAGHRRPRPGPSKNNAPAPEDPGAATMHQKRSQASGAWAAQAMASAGSKQRDSQSSECKAPGMKLARERSRRAAGATGGAREEEAMQGRSNRAGTKPKPAVPRFPRKRRDPAKASEAAAGAAREKQNKAMARSSSQPQPLVRSTSRNPPPRENGATGSSRRGIGGNGAALDRGNQVRPRGNSKRQPPAGQQAQAHARPRPESDARGRRTKRPGAGEGGKKHGDTGAGGPVRALMAPAQVLDVIHGELVSVVRASEGSGVGRDVAWERLVWTIDEDASGVLELRDLARLCRHVLDIGSKVVSSKELEKLFKALDIRREGEVSVTDLIKALKGSQGFPPRTHQHQQGGPASTHQTQGALSPSAPSPSKSTSPIRRPMVPSSPHTLRHDGNQQTNTEGTCAGDEEGNDISLSRSGVLWLQRDPDDCPPPGPLTEASLVPLASPPTHSKKTPMRSRGHAQPATHASLESVFTEEDPPVDQAHSGVVASSHLQVRAFDPAQVDGCSVGATGGSDKCERHGLAACVLCSLISTKPQSDDTKQYPGASFISTAIASAPLDAGGKCARHGLVDCILCNGFGGPSVAPVTSSSQVVPQPSSSASKPPPLAAHPPAMAGGTCARHGIIDCFLCSLVTTAPVGPGSPVKGTTLPVALATGVEPALATKPFAIGVSVAGGANGGEGRGGGGAENDDAVSKESSEADEAEYEKYRLKATQDAPTNKAGLHPGRLSKAGPSPYSIVPESLKSLDSGISLSKRHAAMDLGFFGASSPKATVPGASSSPTLGCGGGGGGGGDAGAGALSLEKHKVVVGAGPSTTQSLAEAALQAAHSILTDDVPG